MISGILSLLLARPGGAKSLIQRIFSYVIGKEASYIDKEFVVPCARRSTTLSSPRRSRTTFAAAIVSNRVACRPMPRSAARMC